MSLGRNNNFLIYNIILFIAFFMLHESSEVKHGRKFITLVETTKGYCDWLKNYGNQR